jgi:hypothetical protein
MFDNPLIQSIVIGALIAWAALFLAIIIEDWFRK